MQSEGLKFAESIGISSSTSRIGMAHHLARCSSACKRGKGGNESSKYGRVACTLENCAAIIQSVPERESTGTTAHRNVPLHTMQSCQRRIGACWSH